jgi:DNA-binding GntR family transcriptional regulator
MRYLKSTDLAPRAGGILGRPRRLADEVYEAILSQLMSLKIPPGGPINIDDLAREFGVSQTPIREALGHLEADGLVVKTQFIGYSAAPQLEKAQFEELYELRLRLEPYLAGKAAETLDDETAAMLRQSAEAMMRPKPGDTMTAYSQFARQDAVLHDRIAAAGRNELMRETLSRLHTHLHLFRLLYHARVTHETIDEHSEIIRWLSARNAEKTTEAMYRHIEKSRDRFAVFFSGE